MFTKKDREKLDNDVKYIEYLSKSYDSDNEYLKHMCDKLSDRACEAECENVELRTKVDLYEKYIQSISNVDSDTLDQVYMFDGELYRLTSRTINEEQDNSKTIIAEFQCVTGITKKFDVGIKT
jgi:hypothetical protein